MSWTRFCEKCELRDLLDTITKVSAYLRQRRLDIVDRAWLTRVRRVFEEEKLAYEIDDDAIVHPAVDKEFQRSRQATVAGLQNARYANSLAAFERVSDELATQPPNGKDAWRSVFHSVEGLFRLMFPVAPQLNAGVADVHMGALVQKLYAGNGVALRAANKQLASFKDWIDSSHNYRHEEGSQEPAQPPIDLAVLAISNGAAFLRWLVSLDQENLAKP